MTNNSPNRYLVEFAPPATKCAEGYLYLVYAPLGLDPKGEGGGGTIGLGDAGTALGAKRSKEINAELEKLTDENNTVLKIFNNMLRSKIITFRLVRLHVPK